MPPKSTGAFHQPRERRDRRGLWSWGPADQTPSRPSVTCVAVPAGSSSGAAPGTRPHPTSAPAAAGPARPLRRSLCSAACRRPARLRRLLSRPLLRAFAVAAAGLDLAPPESPLRPQSHNTNTISARPPAPSPAPAQSPASGCACVVVRVPAGAAPPELAEPKPCPELDGNTVPDIPTASYG